MKIIIVYLLGILLLIGFIIIDLDLIHIKKNKALYNTYFPLSKKDYINLDEEYCQYLYKIVKRQYQFNKEINRFNIRKIYDYYGLDLTNEERAMLDEDIVCKNIVTLNKIQRKLGMKWIGIPFSFSFKLIVFVFIICLFTFVIGLFF